jgi:uncharacterized delta-60 repeat protein
MKYVFFLFNLIVIFGINQLTLSAQTPGSLDTSFNPGTVGTSMTIKAVAVQPDGKILVGGGFNNFNGITANGVARLNADGTVDPTFSLGSNMFPGVNTIALQPDGKILIGGDFNSSVSSVRNRIARLNPDGSLDATFIVGTGFNDAVRSILVQPDGKIIVGGAFTAYNGTARNYIVRLSATGTLETGFPAPINNYVLDMALQPDGKIICGGLFSKCIQRLNSNGTADATFNPGSGVLNSSEYIYTVKLQPDGKILIAGYFYYVNGVTRKSVARLLSNGSLDTNFDVGSGPVNNNYVYAIAPQPDGKILIGGLFQYFNGVSNNRITRVNPDGSVDTGFAPGTAANNEVRAIALQPDGKIIIGGAFNLYNGTPINRIARLQGNSITGVSEGSTINNFAVFPNPNQGRFRLEFTNLSASKAQVTIADLAGKIILNKEVSATDGLVKEIISLKAAKGIYLLQLTAAEQTLVRKIVVD